MNKIQYAAGAALFALTAALSACSSDEAVNTGASQDKVVRVTANVGDMTTRAAYDTQSLDNMGFDIKNTKNTLYSFANVKFTKNGNTWTPASTLLWEDNTQAVDIVAYAPYKDGMWGNLSNEKRFSVEVQTEQTKADNTSDFLVFKHANFVPQTDLVNGAVPVTFSHALSCLTVQVKFGTEYDAVNKLEANPIDSLSIGGTVVRGLCNFTLATPTVSADEYAEPQFVKAYESEDFKPASGEATQETNNATATYECILVPQQVAANAFSVSLTINGETYVWVSPSAVTLNPNSSYTLTLTIGKDAIVMNGLSVKAWTNQEPMERETE